LNILIDSDQPARDLPTAAPRFRFLGRPRRCRALFVEKTPAAPGRHRRGANQFNYGVF
jgi:hypothetical protein